jgi:hypothetical protein
MSSSSKLDVVEVKPPKEADPEEHLYRARPLNSMLLTHPHRLGIVAPSRSGKTNLIVNLLLRDEFYKKYFHRIYIWVPTYFDDDKWKLVELPDEQIFTEFNENDLQEVVSSIQQKER